MIYLIARKCKPGKRASHASLSLKAHPLLKDLLRKTALSSANSAVGKRLADKHVP